MDASKLAWLSLVFALIAPRIQAQTAAGLVYRVPSNCPSEADFVAQVAARGGKFGVDDGRSFEVSVVMQGPTFAGSLRVQRGDQESDAREVTGASCAEVCEALSVVTAIALQPSAAGQAAPAPAAVPAPALAPTASAEPEPVPEGIRTSGSVGNAEVHVEAGTMRFTHAVAGTVRGGAVFGLFSTPMPRLDLTLDETNFVQAPGSEAVRVGAVIRLRAGLIGPLEFRDQDGNRASAYGLQAAVGVCLAPRYDTRGLVALICAEALGGSFARTVTDSLSGAKSKKHAVFAGIGVFTELRYNLGSLFHVSIAGGVESVNSVFGSSSLLGHVSLGVGLHFD